MKMFPVEQIVSPIDLQSGDERQRRMWKNAFFSDYGVYPLGNGRPGERHAE